MSAPGRGYFTDENSLGLGKLMRRGGRADVLYPGHEDLTRNVRDFAGLEGLVDVIEV